MPIKPLPSLSYLVALWLLCYVPAFGQISDSLFRALPDSLRPKNKTIVTLVEKQRMLLHIFSYYLSAPGFKDELQSMASELDKAVTQTKDERFKVETLCALGNCASFFGNSNQAKTYFFKTIAAIGTSDKYSRFQKGAYANLARQYYSSKDKDDSTLHFLHKLLQVKGVEKDSEYVSLSYSYYSQIYNRLQLYEKAIYYNGLSLKTAPTNFRDKANYTVLILNRGISYLYYYAYTKNILYADSAKKIIRNIIATKKTEASNWNLVCYFNLELLYYQLGDYKTSLQMADSAALPVYNKTAFGVPNHYYAVNLFRGLSLLRLGYFDKGKKMVDTITVPRLLYRQLKYEALYEAAQQKQDWQTAFDYYKQYKIISDSINIEGQKGVFFEAEQKYNVAQKQATIARLENQNLIKEKERRSVIAGGIVGFLVLSTLAYATNRRQRAKIQKEREELTNSLHRMEDEMNLQQAQEEAERGFDIANQRKAISQNIHDEVSSGLAALTYLVNDLKHQHEADPKMAEVLDEIGQETHQLYTQSRTFSHSLYNSAIQAEYDIVNYLQNLSLRFDEGSSLQIFTQIGQENIKQHFTPLQHREMFRIIKEAVTNTMKHSGASQMHISIQFQNGQFLFRLADNGKGMGAGVNNKGLGVGSFAERIAMLNGQISLRSSNQGTEITGSFPAVV